MLRAAALAALVAAVATGVWLRCGSLPDNLLNAAADPSTRVVDRHGEVLYEVRSRRGLRGDELRADVLPQLLVHATMAAEDRRFLSHVGIDPMAVSRAAWHNLRERRIVEGGSTVTQQVAKLLLAKRDGFVQRGWRGKLREAIVALRLEHRLTKREIMALYLNMAPYGNEIEGAARASREYFGREPASLTAAEAAYLAALPQQPSRLNPWKNAGAARMRQRRVLATMADHGWLSHQELESSQRERLRLSPPEASFIAPHFVERVLSSVDKRGVRRIETTLDAALQRDVRGIIAAQRDSLRAHHAMNVAVAVLDNRTGEWLAWEGSGNYADAVHGGAIDGVISPRQPGSALKPFTYAAAFERGDHPGRLLPDIPSQFPTAQPGVLYSPRNYDNQFRGPLLARAALAGSENVPAVALAADVGVPAVARLLRRAGLTTLERNAAHYGLGITLGNAEVRLDELVAAYAMLARGGTRVSPTMVRSIDGQVRQVSSDEAERVVSNRTAFWIADVLADAEARAYIFGRGGSLEFPFTVAAKTGTSQSYFDNWAIGYTADVTVGVWVGNFDRTPLRGSSGVTGAGPIFHAVMLAAVERVSGSLPLDDIRPIIAPPPDVQRAELCPTSGLAAGAACPSRVNEWLPREVQLRLCDWHHATDEGPVTVWPDLYRRWARDAGLLREQPDVAVERVLFATPSVARQTPLVTRAMALAIVEPAAGTTFLIDPTLRPEFQTLTLRSRGGRGTTRTWLIDGQPLGVVDSDGDLRWPLRRGRHTIAVRDESGTSTEVWIEVR